MTDNVLNLDDFREKKTQYLHCGFCGAEGELAVIVGRKYYPCPTGNCEEVASTPMDWSKR